MGFGSSSAAGDTASVHANMHCVTHCSHPCVGARATFLPAGRLRSRTAILLFWVSLRAVLLSAHRAGPSPERASRVSSGRGIDRVRARVANPGRAVRVTPGANPEHTPHATAARPTSPHVHAADIGAGPTPTQTAGAQQHGRAHTHHTRERTPTHTSAACFFLGGGLARGAGWLDGYS